MEIVQFADVEPILPELAEGSRADPLVFEPGRIAWLYEPNTSYQKPGLYDKNYLHYGYFDRNSPYFGLRIHGFYLSDRPDDYGVPSRYPVISGLYHKWDTATGRLEQDERLLVVTGQAFGQHKDHLHQPPGLFLAALDIGRYNAWTGSFTSFQEPATLTPKYFSSECFDRRHVDSSIVPVVANPSAAPLPGTPFKTV